MTWKITKKTLKIKNRSPFLRPSPHWLLISHCYKTISIPLTLLILAGVLTIYLEVWGTSLHLSFRVVPNDCLYLCMMTTFPQLSVVFQHETVLKIQKQLPVGVNLKRCPEKFRNIYEKTPVLESPESSLRYF